MAEISDLNVESRAGSGSIKIDPDNSTALPAASMLVSDIGTLEIEYDIEEDTTEVRDLFFSPAKFKFKVFDKIDLDAGGIASLFEELDAISSTTDIDLEFSFTTDGGESWTDDLVFNKNNVEYDRIERELSIEARYYNSAPNNTVSDVFASFASEVQDFNDGTAIWECMAADDYVRNVLDLNSIANTIINTSNEFVGDPFVDGKHSWVVFKNHDGNVYKQEKNANAVLYRLAAVDGSIVGSMMGYSYFCSRTDDTENKSLSESEAESLNINFSLQNYSSLVVFAGSRLSSNNVAPGPWFSVGALYQDSDGLNPDATKSLYVNYYMLELGPATWDATNNEFDDYTGPSIGADTDTGADIDDDPKEGDLVIDISSDPSLSDGDYITINRDPTQLYIVRDSDANSLAMYTPWRGKRGGLSNIWQYTNWDTGLCGDAADGYAKSFGADGARRISMTLLDIDTLKPYETFTLDSTYPAAVQGQTFRPSQLTYDLLSDKIKVNAYQIS